MIKKGKASNGVKDKTMTNELNQILISPSKRLVEIRSAVMQAATFDSVSDEGKQVLNIINEVRDRKDTAVAEYTKEYDDIELSPDEFRVSKEDLEKAHEEIEKDNPELLASIQQAIENVKKYQAEIFIGSKSTHSGIKYTPIKRIGICVPGASAPLPSTVIMTAVPAQVAGVKEITVVSPPRYNGSIHPVILATCHKLKIKNVYRIGGAQAVAALAFGTETIPNVDKIVGPGNKWVQTAKKKIIGFAGIDSIAGPSEVLIIANKDANPAWVAADMLSQAEHAPGSAIVFTDSKKFAEKVLDELKSQVEKLDRSKETIECLKKLGLIVFFDNMDNVIKWANNYAMEHLEIQCGDESRDIAEKIENAGAIFIGDYSPVAVGDYWAGPSHILPTGISARFFSALSANDFIKSTSIIEYDKKKLAESADDIIRLAEAEGLDAHAKSIKIRQEE